MGTEDEHSATRLWYCNLLNKTEEVIAAQNKFVLVSKSGNLLQALKEVTIELLTLLHEQDQVDDILSEEK